jgi:hypothetical protein
MITEDYVSFETAKLLKEKGFNEDSWFHYDADGDIVTRGYRLNRPDDIPAWTHQMIMKWLREVHKIHIEIGYNVGYFPVCIFTKTNETIAYKPMQGKDFTHEQACEAAIKYCLENLI